MRSTCNCHLALCNLYDKNVEIAAAAYLVEECEGNNIGCDLLDWGFQIHGEMELRWSIRKDLIARQWVKYIMLKEPRRVPKGIYIWVDAAGKATDFL